MTDLAGVRELGHGRLIPSEHLSCSVRVLRDPPIVALRDVACGGDGLDGSLLFVVARELLEVEARERGFGG